MQNVFCIESKMNVSDCPCGRCYNIQENLKATIEHKRLNELAAKKMKKDVAEYLARKQIERKAKS